MVLRLRAELRVGTGDQLVSWQGPNLAVSQEKILLSGSGLFGSFCPEQPALPHPGMSQPSSAPTAETVSGNPSMFLLADFSNDTWKQDFSLRVTSPPALLGRVWKNRAAWC